MNTQVEKAQSAQGTNVSTFIANWRELKQDLQSWRAVRRALCSSEFKAFASLAERILADAQTEKAFRLRLTEKATKRGCSVWVGYCFVNKCIKALAQEGDKEAQTFVKWETLSKRKGIVKAEKSAKAVA